MAVESRLLFLLFAVVAAAIGGYVALRKPHLIAPIYRVVDAGRLIIGLVWVLGISWALFTLGGLPGVALAGIVLLLAGAIWRYEEAQGIK